MNDDALLETSQRQPQRRPQQPHNELARCLDASLLDQYLLERCILPSFKTVVPFLPEQYHILLLPILEVIALYWTRGQTPAVRALGLRFETTRSSSTKAAFHLYAMLRCGVPFLTRILDILLVDHHPYPQTSPTSSLSARAVQRQLWLRKILLRIPQKRILPVLRWLVHMLCWSGCVASPELAMVLAGCRYGSNNTISPHVAFAHRRWMWELSWRTALLLGTTSWNHVRMISVPWQRFARPRGASPSSMSSQHEQQTLCPICGETPLQPVVPSSSFEQQQPCCYVCSVQQQQQAKRCTIPSE